MDYTLPTTVLPRDPSLGAEATNPPLLNASSHISESVVPLSVDASHANSDAYAGSIDTPSAQLNSDAYAGSIDTPFAHLNSDTYARAIDTPSAHANSDAYAGTVDTPSAHNSNVRNGTSVPLIATLPSDSRDISSAISRVNAMLSAGTEGEHAALLNFYNTLNVIIKNLERTNDDTMIQLKPDDVKNTKDSVDVYFVRPLKNLCSILLQVPHCH
jgi:hypothetical protein